LGTATNAGNSAPRGAASNIARPAIQFNSTAATSLTGTNAARTITLTGTHSGGNTLAATIGDNGLGATPVM
jgi:hypothetical protein